MLVRVLLVAVLTHHWRVTGWLVSSLPNILPKLFPDVCYKNLPSEFRCFNLRSPYTNTLLHKPQSPADQKIKFNLFTKASPTTAQILSASTKPDNFDSSGKVVCLIHGFTGGLSDPWVLPLKTELLSKTDVTNVILVDWAGGAKGPNYLRAAANTRVVGALLAALLKRLEVDPALVHLVGHSLGAHVAGYTGEKFGTRYYTFHPTPIGRITGLDPAAPRFESFKIRVRLDPTDATFVDVIHTDAEPLTQGGLGMKKLCGDVDFMPNGGHDMPGCPKDALDLSNLDNVADLVESVSCSHQRAPLYFIASIRDNNFPACPCSQSGVSAKTCNSECSAAQSNRMGYHATKSPGGLFYLTTAKNPPY